MTRVAWGLLGLLLLFNTTGAPGAEVKGAHLCFRVVDADRDGVVNFAEFAKHYGEDRPRFEAADTDQDGLLTHDEYHAVLGGGAS